MECVDCTYCHKAIIEFQDSNNKRTDLGIRLVKCLKALEIFEEKKNPQYNQKYKGHTESICIIKEFDCPTRVAHLINICNNTEILTPKWCPLNKK